MSEDLLESVIAEEQSGRRLDRALAELFPDYSRSFLQDCIRRGRVLMDGRVPKPRDLVSGGERVAFRPPLPEDAAPGAEALPLEVVHADDHLLIINKAAGMVVHPAAGHATGTLLNALLHHCPQLAALPRGGIVHRLDKDTSGLMTVAKTRKAHQSLVVQLQERTMSRRYLALVRGRVVAGGEVQAPLGRHPRDRKRIAVVAGGRHAVTRYQVAERFAVHTLLEVELVTGRTHQIRVHAAHIGHPVVGDPVYGGRMRSVAGWSQAQLEEFRSFRRQALHAAELRLTHPDTGETRGWQAALPDDMARLLELIRDAESSAAVFDHG